MKTITYILTIMLFVSCNSNQNQSTKSTTTQQTEVEEEMVEKDLSNFNEYLASIPVLQNGFTYDTESTSTQMVEIESKFKPDGSALIGKLKSIGERNFIIYRYPADILLPILEIYDNEGNKLVEKELVDYAFCADELAMNMGRFILKNDTIIIMNNYNVENGDTTIVETFEININQL